MSELLQHLRFHGVVDIEKSASPLIVCDIILMRQFMKSTIIETSPIKVGGIIITVSHFLHDDITKHSNLQGITYLILCPAKFLPQSAISIQRKLHFLKRSTFTYRNIPIIFQQTKRIIPDSCHHPFTDSFISLSITFRYIQLYVKSSFHSFVLTPWLDEIVLLEIFYRCIGGIIHLLCVV